MNTNMMCEAVGCGSEMTELVLDGHGCGESMALLAKALIRRACDVHAKTVGEAYVTGVGLALLNQKDQPVATKDLQVVTDQLRGIKTPKAQAVYAALGHYFKGIR